MPKATYEITLFSSDIHAGTMRLNLFAKLEDDVIFQYAATVKIQFANDDSSFDKFEIEPNHPCMPYASTTRVLAKTLEALEDAFTADHEFYEQIFADDRTLRFFIEKPADEPVTPPNDEA